VEAGFCLFPKILSNIKMEQNVFVL